MHKTNYCDDDIHTSQHTHIKLHTSYYTHHITYCTTHTFHYTQHTTYTTLHYTTHITLHTSQHKHSTIDSTLHTSHHKNNTTHITYTTLRLIELHIETVVIQLNCISCSHHLKTSTVAVSIKKIENKFYKLKYEMNNGKKTYKK